MAVIQKHHITYEPEFIVQLWARWHREITFIQNTKATPEFERLLKNFVIALQHEWHRVNFQLYELDSKNTNPK